MGKRAVISIKETLSSLKILKRKQSSLAKERRVYALICLKEDKFNTRAQLANHMGITIRSIEKWVVQYNEFGIDDLLKVKPSRRGSKIITAQVHEGLKGKVNNEKEPFRGYWEAQQWVKEKYGIEVNYHRIREYLIKHFGTKVKRPRKSHIDKDPNGQAAFLKTTQHLQGA